MRKNKNYLIGILAFFMVGLVFFSCQKEETLSSKQIAINSFEKALKSKGEKYSNFASKMSSVSMARPINSTEVEEHKKKQEQEAKELLSPLIKDSKKFLLEYGITDDFLREEFGDVNHPGIVSLGILYFSLEKNKEFNIAQAGFFNSLNSVNIYPWELSLNDDSETEIEWDRIANCVGAAFGFNQIKHIFTNTAGLAAAATTREVVTLILKRYSGYVGVALAVHSFGKCMDYW